MSKLKKKKPNKKKEKRTAAIAAVQDFQEALEDLQKDKNDWKTQFPKAASELDQINNTAVEVQRLASVAKAAVSAAGESVGDFKLTKKYKRPCFSGTLLVSQIKQDQIDFETFKELVEAGVITDIGIDQGVAKVLLDQGSHETQEVINSIKDPGGGLYGTAVSIPKW